MESKEKDGKPTKNEQEKDKRLSKQKQTELESAAYLLIYQLKDIQFFWVLFSLIFYFPLLINHHLGMIWLILSRWLKQIQDIIQTKNWEGPFITPGAMPNQMTMANMQVTSGTKRPRFKRKLWDDDETCLVDWNCWFMLIC